MLPRGARRIVDARLAGNRPADPVVVSFVGSLPYGNPTVHAESGVAYDWRWLEDLPVLVAVRPGVDALAALRAIFDVARLYPTLVDVERRQAASILSTRPLRLWPLTERHAGWQELFA